MMKGGGDNNAAPVSEVPGVTDVMDSPEFEKVFADLTAELTAEGISADEVTAKIHSLLILSGDVLDLDDDTDTSSARYSAASLTPESLALIASKFKPAYESGDIIALFFPTSKAINNLYVALGEEPMYIDPEDSLGENSWLNSGDLYPEIYAIAKRYNGTSAHYFSYLVPGSMAIMAKIVEDVIAEIESADVSGDASASPVGNTEDTADEYAGLRGEYVFQARRYAAFIRWAAHIDAEMEKQKEFASSSLPGIVSAAGSSNVFDYSAQRISINFDDYCSYTNWDYWGTHEWRHSAGVNDTVYTFHDFRDRNDYYVVQSNAFYKPEAFEKKTEESNIYTVGSMKKFTYTHGLNIPSAYSLFKNAPQNVNRQSSRTDGTSYSTSNTVGYKLGAKVSGKVGVGKDGLNAEVGTEISTEQDTSTSELPKPKGIGLLASSATPCANAYRHLRRGRNLHKTLRSLFRRDAHIIRALIPKLKHLVFLARFSKGSGYNHSATWTTTEWSLINECDNTFANWKVDFYDPARKGYFPDWDTGDVPNASKNRVDLDSEWMWQVTKPTKNLSMITELSVTLHSTKMDGHTRYEHGKTDNSYVHVTKLAQPPHVVCTYGGSHTFNKDGADNILFRFLCSGNWTIKSDSDWCMIAQEDAQGSDTGETEREVFFFVDPYDTGSDRTPHTRRAKLTITDSETGQTQTIDVVQSNR